MPLPPVSTLQAADTISAEQLPQVDKTNVGPPPTAAPTPLPGTGQFQGGTGSFSQQYAATVLGTKQQYDPGHPQLYSGQDVFNPRYSSILPGEDSEEAFAKAQPWYNKWANATVKMGATAAGTFWNGIAAIPDAISGIKNGKGPYDTAGGAAIDTWLKNLEDEFPNYYTKWEQQHPFLSAIPFVGTGGGANFWSDKFLKNLGFTIGAIGGAAAQDLVVGALTEGIGEIPLIGGQIGKAALYLNKVFTGTDKVGDLLQLGKAAGRTGEQLLDLKRLANAASYTKVANGTRFAMNLYGAAASEAGFEAREGYTTVKKDLTDDYIKTNGYAPIGKDLDEIEGYSKASGNVRFGVNLALLGLSDAIQFDAFLKPFSAAKAGMRGSLQRELEGGAGTIGLKKGSIDEFERVKATTRVGRYWDNVRPLLPAVLSEGVYEEGGQYAAQIGTQNYYERKYLYDKNMDKKLYKGDDTSWDARGQIGNILHSVGNGLANEFGTTEGWENIFLGGLTGLLTAGVEHFKDRNANALQRKTILDLLNKEGVTGTIKNVYDTAVTAQRISADMKQAARYGDVFKYKNLQHEQFVNFIGSGIKAGRFDLRMAQLDLLKDMSDAEFKKAFGLDKTTESVKTVTEYVDTLKDKAKEIKKSYDLIDKTYNNPYTFKKKSKSEADELENEKFQEFQGWKDALLFLTSIIPDTNRRKKAISKNIQQIDAYINPGFVQDLTRKDKVVDYAQTLKIQAKILEDGLKNDLSTDKPKDRARLALLTSKIDHIEKVLAAPTSAAEDNLFEDLLNFQLNGETDSTDIQIPKAAIPELRNMGIDLNRLDEYKKSANKAFEILSTKKGLDKYFADVQAAKDRANAAQQAATKTPPPTPPPAPSPVPTPPPVPVPPPVRNISLTKPDGSKETFDLDKQYLVNLGQGLEAVKIIDENPQGITVEKADGTKVLVKPEDFFAQDELGEELDREVDITTTDQDVPPTPPSPNQGVPDTKEGESKKDLAFAPLATTDPLYSDKTTPDDNFQRRHQNFLFNIGSQDPDVFNQENKPLLRIIPVTAKIQEQLGFPKDWIADKGDNPDNSSIRAVYVIDKRALPEHIETDKKNIQKMVSSSRGITDILKNMFRTDPEGGINYIYDQYNSGDETREELESGLGRDADDIMTQVLAYKEGSGVFFADAKGDTIGRVESPVDPSKAIYTNFSTTDLFYGGEGQEENRYTNKENLDEKKVMDWWREKRKGTLERNDLKGHPLYQFSISRGLPNVKNKDARNSVIDSKLITEADLDKPVIEVLTLGNVAINGALNSEGEGISAHKASVNMGDMGKQVLNYGTNLLYLDPRRLNEAEAKNIFELLKILASRSTTGKREIFQYLNKVIYLPNLSKGASTTASSIAIQGPNLFLGKATTPIQMDPSELEKNKDKILEYLQTAFHSVNNTELLRIAKNPKANDLVFREMKVKDGKIDPVNWKNYNHYLLSNKHPEGGKRADVPLATKIIAPQEGEVPIIQKYSVLSNIDMDSKLFQRPAVQAATTGLTEAQKQGMRDLGWKDTQFAKFTANMVDKFIAAGMTPEEIKARMAAENQTQGVQEAPSPVPEVKETQSEAPVEDPTRIVLPAGAMKFLFNNIVRDENGNITDFEPEGILQEDGSITPIKDKAKVKEIFLNKIKGSQIKQDETTAPEKKKSLRDQLLDPNRKKGTDPQYRSQVITPGTYTKGNIDKEFAEFEKMLPGVPIHKVDQMLRTTSGGLAWGALENAMVYVYKNAEVGTTYHEAFEAVWGHFLDGKEQQSLYNEFIGRNGQFMTYAGQTKDFNKASLKEAKEQMAEEFRDYKLQNRSPKNAIERFFQRVIDFIKRFIFGDKTLKNKLFQRINRGEYRNYSTSLKNIDEAQYRRPGLDEFSEAFIQDALQGMTVDMFMDLFKENQDIIIQLEENPERAAKVIYDKLLNNFTHFFEEDEAGYNDTLLDEMAGDNFTSLSPEEQDMIEGQILSIREGWQKVKDNWESFVKEHKRYLKTFNVEYEVDDEGNISFAEDEQTDDDNKSQSEYDRDILLIDAKNAASPKIKLLVATIADSVWKKATENAYNAVRGNETIMRRDNSLLALPKQAAYAKLFNYMLHNLSNINGIYDIWSKMKNMVKDPNKRKPIDANVQRVMNRLNLDNGFKGKTIDQIKMALALENTLSKQKPAFFRQFIDFTRKTFFKTSVLNSKLNQVKNQWIAGMRASDAVTATAQGNFLFSHDLEEIKDPFDFLKKIGIPIEKWEYNRLKGKDLNRFNSATNKIMGVIKKAAKAEQYLSILSPRELDFNNRLDELAEIYISNITGDDSQSQHPNLDNEQTSNFVLNNYVSTVLSDANNSASREEFINRIDNQYFKDIFHKDSILLNKVLFDEDGKKTDKSVEVGIVEGREAWNGENKSAATLTEAERQLYEVNNNLNGVFYTLLPADAKTEWAIYVGTYLSTPNFFGSDIGRRDEISKFSHQMYQWLATEVALAKNYDKRTNIAALNREIGDRKIGNSLRFFADILDKDIVDKIHKQVIDGKKSLEEVYTEPELRAKLIEFTTEKAQSSLKNLADWRLVDYDKDENTFKLNGFDKNFLNTYIEDKDVYAEAEALKVLTFREMNYIMNNIEMHKFFFGDPAQYKDELKRIKSFLSGREATHVDTLGTDEGLNQVLNEELNKVNDIPLLPSDPGYQQHKNHFNTFTIYDVDYSSSQLKEIEKAIGDRSKPYKKGNEADAQAWMMATAYREAMYKAGGRFTAAQERQFQWEMAWERQDKAKNGLYKYTNREIERADKELLKGPENSDVYFPILKLVHSGVQTTDQNVAISSIDKASWAPLFYRWYKGTTLGKVYNSLQEKGIDYVRMESAHKVGIQEDASTQMYNEKGEFNKEGFNTVKNEKIPLKHLGIQVEQAKKEKGQTEGSQARKIVTSDLRSNGIPLDFLEGKDENSAFTEWNAMNTEQKLAASPIYQKIQRHETVLKRLTEARTDQTMNRLGIVQKNGKWVIPDKEGVSKFILDELERRELPRNIAIGLEVDPKTNDFTQPLEANAQYTKIRSIIYSVMEKTIMRPKVSGGQKTMLSVTGFEKGPRVVERMVSGKPVYTSDTLKFYTRGEDGTQACEVMLPYWFGKQMMAMGSKRTKEEVIKYLNTTEEGKKLLTGVGFRIPTQGLNSIDFFVIKDFLPEQMGDVIVLPSEITAKAGSDFDIDKLNTYLRNFYVDNSTGYPKVVKWQGTPEKTKEYIGKLLDSGNIISTDDKKELDRFLEEEKDYAEDLSIDDLVMRIPGVASLFDEDRITRDFLGNYRQVLMDKIYMQALENEYFDSIETLLSLPENYSRLISPNDASQMKEDRDYIKKLITEREGEGEEKLGIYGRLLDSNFMMKERHAYLMSKGVVGTSAVSQTAHAVAQNLDGGLVVIDPYIVARFPHNEIDGMISLSGLTTAGNDQNISNINAQTTDGGVDVAKDKFLAEMGINKDTLGTFLALTRMGAPRRWSELFLNQPAIQRFLKLKAIHDSVSQINSSIERLPQWALNEKIYAEYGGMDFNKDRLKNKPSKYTQKDMEEMVKSKTLTHEQQTLQLMMLDDYQKYNSLGWDLFHYYQGYNWDTARLNDPNEIRLKKLKYDKALELSVSSVSRVMDDTFIGEMKNATLRLDEGLRSMINVQTGAAGEVLDMIAKDIFNQGGLGQYDRSQIMLAAEISMVDFSVQTGSQINGKPMTSYIRALLMSEKSVARYIQVMKDMKDARIANNPFIKNLIALIDQREGWPSTIQLAERDYDTYTSNIWTDSFRELKDDAATVVSINNNENDDRTVAQVYKNLALTAIIESGSRKTSTSLSHLVPNETYSEFTRDALRNMKLEGFYENDVMYRVNWNNDKLVPLVKPYYPNDLDPEYYEYPLFRGKESMVFTSLQALTGTENPAGILNVEGWRYKNAKVIKIKETRNIATGERFAVPLIRIFTRVDVMGEDEPEPLRMIDNPKNLLFKEINPWGDGNNIQEYHEGTAQSILPNNVKVNEVSNDQIIYALYKAGYETNTADSTLHSIIMKIEGDTSGPDMDEDGNETPDNDKPGPKKVPPTDAQTEPEDKLEECAPGVFSVKTKK